MGRQFPREGGGGFLCDLRCPPVDDCDEGSGPLREGLLEVDLVLAPGDVLVDQTLDIRVDAEPMGGKTGTRRRQHGDDNDDEPATLDGERNEPFDHGYPTCLSEPSRSAAHWNAWRRQAMHPRPSSPCSGSTTDGDIPRIRFGSRPKRAPRSLPEPALSTSLGRQLQRKRYSLFVLRPPVRFSTANSRSRTEYRARLA